MKQSGQLFLLLLPVFLLTGCALSQHQTARQLDAGETVWSLAADAPANQYIPRVSVQRTTKRESGDYSCQAASNLSFHNITVTGRFYLSELLTLGIAWSSHIEWNPFDLAAPRPDGPFPLLREARTITGLTMRLSTTVNENRPFYGGVLASSYLVFRSILSMAGGFIGYEFMVNDRTGLQFELASAPLIYDTYETGSAYVLMRNTVLTGGVNWRFGVETTGRDAPQTTPGGGREGFLSDAEPTVRRTESSEESTPEASDTDARDADVAGDEWAHSISREEIRSVIRFEREEFTLCYEAQLHLHPNLAGQITVSFLINDEGRVAQATVERSTMNAPEVESCVLEVIRALTFPELEPGEEIRVDYPFNFSRI